ncbi:MAG: CehA/McbA family metallohydrolase [Planctomycetota bacterium]
MHRIAFPLLLTAVWATVTPTLGDELPIVADVEFQPLAAQARRVVEALDYLGEPLAARDKEEVLAACESDDPPKAIKTIQQVFDKYALVGVEINPESRVKTALGAAKPELTQQGWRNFLVKVHNEAGVTAELKVSSPNALPQFVRSSGSAEPKEQVKPKDVPHRFLDVEMFSKQPLNKNLSGLPVEYRILQLYCRDVGSREAKIGFNVGQGTQDIGFRNEVNILFRAVPATPVTLGIKDVDGKPVMASFIFRDKFGRVFPAQARRLAPDFFFHPQIYRADGETVLLPAGEYTVEFNRGPEYLVETRKIQVPEGETHREDFQLHRWIEPKKVGWWSGDHHVHGAGCAHYENPTQGVTPADMFRHILGEDLNVGCVLSWGPCWYYQKQYFQGKVHELSQKEYLMRYDVEVSGFPSSHAGHLCLLNLKEDDYPNTSRIEEWPSWDLPVLQWGKKQGGVVGFSHSGWGLDVNTEELPNYKIPPFSGIGANEYIVDVVHDACDFISSVDTPVQWELNIWYHTLNCGYRCRISGETDFPCIYGERVGLGRIYVKLDGQLDFDQWVQGLKDGRSYVSDGLSHLIDFKVNDLGVGEKGSTLSLDAPKNVTVTAKVAALLGEEPNETIRRKALHEKPYWHVERSRVGNSRKVPVELIVNGYPVAKTEIVADGTMQNVKFDVPIPYSSWVALRILPSSHTNPVFIEVAGKPIRASRRSADWCVKSVDQCWKSKEKAIKPSEREEVKAAFDAARAAYVKIRDEAVAD